VTPKLIMGRRRIEIEYIDDSRVRQVTLCKRRVGIFKKASDLSKLCGVEVAIVILDPGKKVSEYGTTDVDRILERYKQQKAGGPGEDNSEAGRLWEQLEAQRKQLEATTRELEAEKVTNEQLRGLVGLQDTGRPLIKAECGDIMETSPGALPAVMPPTTAIPEIMQAVSRVPIESTCTAQSTILPPKIAVQSEQNEVLEERCASASDDTVTNESNSELSGDEEGAEKHRPMGITVPEGLKFERSASGYEIKAVQAVPAFDDLSSLITPSSMDLTTPSSLFPSLISPMERDAKRHKTVSESPLERKDSVHSVSSFLGLSLERRDSGKSGTFSGLDFLTTPRGTFVTAAEVALVSP